MNDMKLIMESWRKYLREELSEVRKPQRTPDEELIIKMAKQHQDPDEDYDYDYHDFEEARKGSDDFQAGKEMPEITHPSYYRSYKNDEELDAMEKQMSRELDDQIASRTPEEIAYADANPISLKQLAAKMRTK